MKKKLLSCLALTAMVGITQATVLTFDTDGGMPQAYGDRVTNTTMGAYSYGESGEGSTPNVEVEYIGVGGDGLDWWGPDYGDLVNVVENEDDGERWTSIRFTADFGCKAVLHSTDLGNFNSESLLIDSMTITNESGAVLFQQNNITLEGSSSGHTNINFGSVTGSVLTLVLDLQTAAVTDDNDSVGLDNITFSQTGTALFPNAVELDGNVPANLGVDGTESDPNIYIIGATNAYTRNYGTTPLILGWNGRDGGSYGSDGRSYVQLYIQNGSTVISGDGSCVGQYYNKSHRLVRLTDASSWIVDGKLFVPSSGNGDRLEVFGGSLVSATNLIVAGASDCTGTIVVSNANSRVISTGNLGGGTSAGAGSYIYMEDHGLVQVDGPNAYFDVAYFNEGFFAWAGDHTSDSSHPFNASRFWNGTNWQDQIPSPVVFTETYCATDAEAKLLTSDPDSEFAGYDNLGGYTIWTASIPTIEITNTLTVVSEHGSPIPSVGTTHIIDGSVIACSVDSVTSGTTNYSPTGWTLTGQEPASGTTNGFELTSTTNAVLTWNWQTNYWLDVNVTGNGSVDISDGFYAEDSELVLTASPDAGWLFMGWSGDASGTTPIVFTMDEPKTVMATFSDDADDDGLTNAEEEGLGSNPWKKDTDDDGFDDAFEVAQGLSVTNGNSAIVDYIANHGSTFELYPSNVVLDVAVGQMLIETAGGTASLTLQLEESDDLVTWSNAGPSKVWSWPVDGEKQFFRVRASE
jgi:hypothetical protein